MDSDFSGASGRTYTLPLGFAVLAAIFVGWWPFGVVGKDKQDQKHWPGVVALTLLVVALLLFTLQASGYVTVG